MDVILDLDSELYAICVHWPCDPDKPLAERTDEEVGDYFVRLCRMNQTCKTVANRHQQARRAALLHYWNRKLPESKVSEKLDGVVEMDGQRWRQQIYRDQIDLVLVCTAGDKDTHRRMMKTRVEHQVAGNPYGVTHYGSFEQTVRRYRFFAQPCANPHHVAFRYAKGLSGPLTDHYGVCKSSLIGRLPIQSCERYCAGFHDKENGMQHGPGWIPQVLQRKPALSLQGTDGTNKLLEVEVAHILVDHLIILRLSVPGGTLKLTGRIYPYKGMLDIGNHSLNVDAAAWNAEASRRGDLALELPGVEVYWETAAFYAAASPLKQGLYAGVARQKRASQSRTQGKSAAPQQPQGRCAESDESDED
tara:strand:- start:4963 stop:6045 length:1083 start_codon:yes stop_codon:yes gene_type:complete